MKTNLLRLICVLSLAMSLPFATHAQDEEVVFGVAVVSPPAPWVVSSTDGSLHNALKRWGRRADYKIVWSVAKDFPAMDATYEGDFEKAVEDLMQDTAYTGIPLHSCIFNNRVVRVLRLNQPCDLMERQQ
jgi:hypothetical protein